MNEFIDYFIDNEFVSKITVTGKLGAVEVLSGNPPMLVTDFTIIFPDGFVNTTSPVILFDINWLYLPIYLEFNLSKFSIWVYEIYLYFEKKYPPKNSLFVYNGQTGYFPLKDINTNIYYFDMSKKLISIVF